MPSGQRETITYRGFTGYDIKRSGLYPEAFVPSENVVGGALLDARNLRFSQGRAYWHRNQLWVSMPAGLGQQSTALTIGTAVRVSNVVTVTVTDTQHAMATGDVVVIAGCTSGFNGKFTVTSRPAANQFTFAQTAANASGSGGTVTPKWPLGIVEYVSDTLNQLLCLSDEGKLYYMNVNWTTPPTQTAYGYQLFSALSWTAATAAEMPTYPITGYCNMSGYLFMCAGEGTGYEHGGLPTQYYDGATLARVGFETPLTAPTATADATGTNYLEQGTYSYRVVVGNDRFESMPGPVVDVVVANAQASATISPHDASTLPSHGDTVTIDGQVYRFVLVAGGFSAGETFKDGDVLIVSHYPAAAANIARTYTNLFNALTVGQSLSDKILGTASTPPLANCDVTWATGGVLTIKAKTVGVAGNAITLAESTSGARIHVGNGSSSAITLSGGGANCHIDLSAIPVDASGAATFRKLYRAYTTDISEGARGDAFQYAGLIQNNTTTTYADNTPQAELGEPISFDHAIPPRGSVLTSHRDRLWMAGVTQTSNSYSRTLAIVAATGAVRASNVVTITTTTKHGLVKGDWVNVWGTTGSTFDGNFQVASCPTDLTFTYAQSGANETSGGGGIICDIFYDNLNNILFYSHLDEPFYWPASNQIMVGGTSPILALVSWHDQLLILKSDSAWLLTGYGESDWQLVQLPGVNGAIGNHVAASSYGVVWAGHNGWVLWDGQQVRTLIEYSETSTFTSEQQNISPPPVSSAGLAPYPCVCYHGERFYFLSGDYLYCWRPEVDTWEVRWAPCSKIGIRALHFGAAQSHIISYMQWFESGATYSGSAWLTVLDSHYMPSNPPYGNYGDSPGSSTGNYYGRVCVELPPIVAPPGETVNPLELWVYGEWTKPASDADDLKLKILSPAGVWTTIGTVTADGRLGIPPGYATNRLRLRLESVKTPYFALFGASLAYDTRAARGT